MSIKFKNQEEFQKLLIKNGYSNRDFSTLAGISDTHLSFILNGKRGITPATAKKIADALKLKFDDLFYIE